MHIGDSDVFRYIQMKKLQRLIFLILTTFLSTLIITNYLFYKKLTEPKKLNMQNSRNLSVEDKIIFYSNNLPVIYNRPSANVDNITETFLRNVANHVETNQTFDIWKLTNSWVSSKGIIDASHSEVGSVLYALKYAPITRADLDGRGTQLKFLFTLQGDQDVIFKPKWYEKDRILEGPVYGGRDRHNSEIVAFYLSIILNQPFVPYSTERKVSLKNEILHVASRKLLDTKITLKNKTCIYGKCFYCSKKDAICADQSDSLTGAVIFNIKSSFKIMKSPWMRTYKKGKKAPWEQDKFYCRTVKASVTQKRLLEMIDISIFDFLIQNGDRHHYELMGDILLMLDNGKGLGNPYNNHIDILAPLYQCCMMRKKTWKKLLTLSGKKISHYLKKMPDLMEIVQGDHLIAMDKRLLLIYGAVEYCRNEGKMIFL